MPNNKRKRDAGKKRVLLVNPVVAGMKAGSRTGMPLGLLAIGSYLKKHSGYDVVIVDALCDVDYMQKIRKIISEGVVFAGISVMSAAINSTMEIMGEIKKIDPDTKIVWGGPHCKLYTKETAEHPLIDAVVHYEGEIPSKNLADAFSRNRPIDGIKGIAFKKGSRVIVNPREELLDLDVIYPLNYELIDPRVFRKKVVNLNTSRGCPHRCTFCINIATCNVKWRGISGEKLVEQMLILSEKHGVEEFYFRDENFFCNKKRAEYVFDQFIKLKKRFRMRLTCRVDYFRKGLVDDKLLKMMKEVGVYQFHFGVESGSPKMLKFLKKDITKDDVLYSIRQLKKFGLAATYSFMVGLPKETKTDLLETIDFIKKISREYKGFASFQSRGGKVSMKTPNIYINGPQPFRPYPGGELYEYIVKKYDWKMPRSIEEWEKYFDEFNRYRIEDYPWVQNPKMITALQFYLNSGRLVFSDFVKKIIAPYPIKLRIIFALFYPFAKIRTMLNWYRFPFEYLIAKGLGLIDQYES